MAVLIVTYGERWAVLDPVIRAALSQPCVVSLTIVDNGCGYSLRDRVRSLGLDTPIDLITNVRNEGSASAVTQGLRHVERVAEADFVLILDDDNLLEQGALDSCREHLRALSERDALVLYRSSRPEQRRLVEKARPVTHAANAYGGLSATRHCSRLLRNVFPSHSSGAGLHMDYAPYGGLLFRNGILGYLRPPRTDFFLYADDHEFTTRLVRSGGRLTLVPEAVVSDLEVTWHHRRRSDIFIHPTINVHSPALRVYYGLRNRLVFEHELLVTSAGMRSLNRAYFWAVLVVGCAIQISRGVTPRELMTRLSTIRRAIRDADLGTLGQRFDDVRHPGVRSSDQQLEV